MKQEKDLCGYVYIDGDAQDYFALRVSSDNMINVGIVPGALLIVHKQSFAFDGDIVVVSVDGESKVLRYKKNDGVTFLMPENSARSPILITEKTDFHIFGKVIEYRLKI